MRQIILSILAFLLVCCAVVSLLSSDGRTNLNNILGGLPVIGDFLDGKSIFHSSGSIVNAVATIGLSAALGLFLKTSGTWWGQIIEEIILTISSAFIVSAVVAHYGSQVLAYIIFGSAVLCMLGSRLAENIWVEIIKKAFVYLILSAIFQSLL